MSQVGSDKSKENERSVPTGIRTVLMPLSEIHCQSSSTIQSFQWRSRTFWPYEPFATSWSLCPGCSAKRKGLSAIHLSRTNQEPGVLKIQSMFQRYLIGSDQTKVYASLFSVAIEIIFRWEVLRGVGRKLWCLVGLWVTR